MIVKVDSCAICTLEKRIYNGGMKRYPFAGEHEVAGTVAEVVEAVKRLKKDDKVAASLLSSRMVDPSILISETVPLDKIECAFQRAIDPKTYRIVVRP